MVDTGCSKSARAQWVIPELLVEDCEKLVDVGDVGGSESLDWKKSSENQSGDNGLGGGLRLG